jgi:hypothetical protein
VRAELVVKYKRGDIVEVLTAAYGAHNPTALRQSKLWLGGKEAAKKVTYAASTPSGLTVMAWTSPGRAEIYVESSTGRLRSCSEKVWEAIQDNGKTLRPKRMRPKLHSLELIDPVPSDVVATASVGLGKLVRDQLFVPVATGVVTAVVLVVAIEQGASQDFVYGSITALTVAILSLVRLISNARSKKLIWR